MRKSDDTIGRAVAVDALERIFDRCEEIEAHLPDGDPDKTGYKMLPDYMTVWKYLRQLPPAQLEIIRCKDCKHWLDIDDGRQKHRMCADICGDWFCADAERRTDDER